MASLPRVVDPPVYDPPIVDSPSGQRHSQAWTEYHQSVSDKLAQMYRGVTDGSDAAAGNIGEYLTNTSGAVALTSGAIANVVSLDLTAGDWDVSGNVIFTPSAGTHSFFGVGMDAPDVYLAATFSTAALNQALNTAPRRYNVTATTTVWVVAQAVFAGTCTATGTVRARRIR